MRTTIIIVATAAMAFAAGFWTKGTMATGAAIINSSGISPTELHLRVNPAELPQQQVDNYN
jgi:hypothetical protein